MLRTIALLTLLAVTSAANAVMITLDPNRYELGTNLSDIHEGLSIARLSWPNGSPWGAPLPPDRSDVYVDDCAPYYSCLTPTSLGFGGTYQVHDYAGCMQGTIMCQYSGISALEFTFDGLTDSVSMLFTFGSDTPIMYAYDINGSLIDTCAGRGCSIFFEHGMAAWGAVLTINRAERDIHRIVAGGMAGTSFAQSIAYSVPEPGTFALFGIGLAGLLVRRRVTARLP